MDSQLYFLCAVRLLIKRMLIAGALGLPVLKAIFGLFLGMLELCVGVIGRSNGPRSEAGRHMGEVLPSTASHSLLYRPLGGRDPTITLPEQWERAHRPGIHQEALPPV